VRLPDLVRKLGEEMMKINVEAVVSSVLLKY
jgi:hypothetical protein